QRSADRTDRAGNAETALLPAIAPRQPAVRAGPRSRGAGALRRLRSGFPDPHRHDPGRARPGGLRRRIPEGARPRLGSRHHRPVLFPNTGANTMKRMSLAALVAASLAIGLPQAG